MLKRPLEMIAEWRKGCTNAGPMWERCYPDRKPGDEDRRSPAACIECTDALISALEEVLREPSTDMVEDVAGSQAWDYRSDGDESRADARLIYRVMTGAEPVQERFVRLHDAPEPGKERT